MYDEAHTSSKLFWRNVQVKQCGDSWLSTGPVLGDRPKLAVQLMGCARPPTAGTWHINTCLWNKWTSLLSHSHSVFYPQHDLGQFASLVNVIHLFELFRERSAKCHVATLSQRGHRDNLSSMAIQTLPRRLFEPRLFAFPWQNLPFLSMFLIHKGQTRQTLGRHCLYLPFDRLEIEFSQPLKEFFPSGLQSRFIGQIWICSIFVYGLGAKWVGY